MSNEECRSPIGLDCCSCCLDLANGCEPEPGRSGHTSLGSPTSVNHFRQLRDQLHFQNLNTDKLNNIMRQDSLESVVRDPCYLLNEGICNSNIDQTMLSILLYFHRALENTVNRCLCVSWYSCGTSRIKNVPGTSYSDQVGQNKDHQHELRI
ncbi:TSC22 domain family protein 3 isoform X1 [Danio rerio]|uniref:TSC22 domain family protein 3 isoform X1 n=1 Tax=Danio rerio TaxID=7955 RepID=A0AC58H5W7_DANRE|nr:TSC22 domain family protein 3 isoform X2 [Danio rerio]|eukprot:XP_009289294.1 TSC22 domain family protein 3 isoform X2 [Danio rerio]